MVARTQSSSRPATNRPARASVLVGLLALALPPIAFAAANRLQAVTLLDGVAGASFAAVLGLAAIVLARRGRRASERTLGRIGGEGLARIGGVLGAFGVWIGLTAALALGFFALLQLFG